MVVDIKEEELEHLIHVLILSESNLRRTLEFNENLISNSKLDEPSKNAMRRFIEKDNKLIEKLTSYKNEED